MYLRRKLSSCFFAAYSAVPLPPARARQVTDALVPRVLTLRADTSLPEAMRALRLTRNEFAVVVGPTGFETFEASSLLSASASSAAAAAAGETAGVTGGDVGAAAAAAPGGGHAQTVLAEVRTPRVRVLLGREPGVLLGGEAGREESANWGVGGWGCFTLGSCWELGGPSPMCVVASADMDERGKSVRGGRISGVQQAAYLACHELTA